MTSLLNKGSRFLVPDMSSQKIFVKFANFKFLEL